MIEIIMDNYCHWYNLYEKWETSVPRMGMEKATGELD